MDDRLQKIRLNNPIPLHFYEPNEKLPDDVSGKIIICDNGEFYTGYYGPVSGRWFIDNEPIDTTLNVIAWASFSPEWVLGVDL